MRNKRAWTVHVSSWPHGQRKERKEQTGKISIITAQMCYALLVMPW